MEISVCVVTTTISSTTTAATVVVTISLDSVLFPAVVAVADVAAAAGQANALYKAHIILNDL